MNDTQVKTLEKMCLLFKGMASVELFIGYKKDRYTRDSAYPGSILMSAI